MYAASIPRLSPRLRRDEGRGAGLNMWVLWFQSRLKLIKFSKNYIILEEASYDLPSQTAQNR